MDAQEQKNYLAMWDGELSAERNPTNYQRQDDGSHIFHNENDYYEWWYFDAAFDNGYHVVITFHYHNVFLKPMAPSIQIFIYKPDGQKIEKYDLSPMESISAHPDYCNVKMGDSWVRDMGDHYELSIMVRGVGAKLRFTNTVPSWKPGRGFNYKNEDTGKISGWVVPQPCARVEGDLIIKDEVIPVQGSGYHDHNWGNCRFHEIFWGWYWGRIQNPKYTIVYGWVIPKDKTGPIVTPLLIARDGELLLSTNTMEGKCLEIGKDEKFQREYPTHLTLTTDAQGVKMNLGITAHRLIEAMQLPPSTDWPQYYNRCLAHYKLDLEVDGKKDLLEGEFLHETMLLQEA